MLPVSFSTQWSTCSSPERRLCKLVLPQSRVSSHDVPAVNFMERALNQYPNLLQKDSSKLMHGDWSLEWCGHSIRLVPDEVYEYVVVVPVYVAIALHKRVREQDRVLFEVEAVELEYFEISTRPQGLHVQTKLVARPWTMDSDLLDVALVGHADAPSRRPKDTVGHADDLAVWGAMNLFRVRHWDGECLFEDKATCSRDCGVC
jgi:hypothetical protein